MRVLNGDGTESHMGEWVQVSRLGMPLTNEAVIPIGAKDEWNARTPYNENPDHFEFFYNPELALYMDDSLFGAAVPALSSLRIQRNSLQMKPWRVQPWMTLFLAHCCFQIMANLVP